MMRSSLQMMPLVVGAPVISSDLCPGYPIAAHQTDHVHNVCYNCNAKKMVYLNCIYRERRKREKDVKMI